MSKVTVHFPQGAKTIEAEGSLLEAAYDEDLPITFGCQSGKCGVCVVKILSGNLEPATKVEQAVLEGFDCSEDERLACLAYIGGDVELKPVIE
jgi:ferredoxin